MEEDSQASGRYAIDLVRYALACHASGKPIKREGIKAQVLATSSIRSARTVHERANELLTQHFGLKMVALPSHEKRLTDNTQAPPTQQQAKPVPAATKWVLQSVLKDRAREQLELVQTQEQREVLGFAAMVLSLVFVSNMSVSMDQLVLYV
ncbi:hypothetical protein GGI21_005842, partial [Coemansia aciculifera]